MKLRPRTVGAPLVTPGAPPGHNVPAAPALRQSPHTASTVVPATVRACVGHPGVINGAPTAAVSVAAMKHGDETAAANRRGATRDARCPVGAQREPPHPHRVNRRIPHQSSHRNSAWMRWPSVHQERRPSVCGWGRTLGRRFVCPAKSRVRLISSRVRGCRWR